MPPPKKPGAKAGAKRSPKGPSPAPAAEEPSTASPAASATPSASEPGLVADPGPEFDAEAAAEQPPPEGRPIEEVAPEEEYWEEKVIAGLLRAQGKLLHAGIGVAEQDWRYTAEDLEDIVAPATRICNRYIPQLAKYADPAVLAGALMTYATRSLTERKEALAEQAPEPDTEEIPPADTSAGQAPPPAPEPKPAPAGAFPDARVPAPAPAETVVVQSAEPVEGLDPSQVEWQL